MPMTRTEFQAFIGAANDELRRKQNAMRDEHGFGTFASWWITENGDILQFFNESDRLALEASFIVVGTYAPADNTWKWAWSDASIDLPVQERVAKLKELEGITGIRMFGRGDAFEINGEPMAWELTAMAVKHLGALGCYMLPAASGEPASFLAITAIRTAGADAP